MQQRNTRGSGTEFIASLDNRTLYRKKRVLVPAAFLLVIIVAAVASAIWYYRSPDEVAKDAANAIQVDIPDEATQVSAHDDRISIQGGCSDLSFLLPTSQWRAYVSQQMQRPLTPSNGPPAGCSDNGQDCNRDMSMAGPDNYAANDQIRNNDSDSGGAKDRGLYVVPDCQQNRTLISWSAYDM